MPVKDGKKESKLLQLCCDKALSRMGWLPTLSFAESIRLTAEWYKNYYGNCKAADELSYLQIEQYVRKAAGRNAPWATGRMK